MIDQIFKFFGFKKETSEIYCITVSKNEEKYDLKTFQLYSQKIIDTIYQDEEDISYNILLTSNEYDIIKNIKGVQINHKSIQTFQGKVCT